MGGTIESFTKALYIIVPDRTFAPLSLATALHPAVKILRQRFITDCAL